MVEGSFEASFRVLLSEIKKIWFLLISGIWDLNHHIWTFRLEKQFLCKYWPKIVLSKLLRGPWKHLLELFFLKWIWNLGATKTYWDIQAWVAIHTQVLTQNYAMKEIQGSLEASFRVLFSETNKIWSLSIIGNGDLNSDIWIFRPEKLFFQNFCLRIALWKWFRARWKRLLEFFFLK